MQVPDVDIIAVGVDGTEASVRAFEWALEEAKRSARRLDIVHVWHAGVRGAREDLEPRATLGLRDAGFVMLRRLVHKAHHQGALLVVGTHGRSPLAADVLGTVSGACDREAPCAVVVVPAAGAANRASSLAS